MEISSEQKYCLKWNQFNLNLKKSILGMRESGELVDVTVLCEDGIPFLAHRVILAAASSFFREIFTHMDNNHPWIYLKGILSQQMKFILDFVYQGEVEVPEDDLPDFLSSAGDLKIQGLTKYANGGVLSALDSIGDHDNNQIIEKNDFVDLEADNNTNTDNDGSNEVELTDHLVITEEEQEASVMATENFIEVNAELDKQIEDILVKSNGVWTCKACGKSANHKSKLKQHVETHIDGFSHPCGICGKSYRSRNVLRMHLSRDHRNKKNNKQKLFL